LKIAGNLGAAYTINPLKQNTHDSLVDITAGFGPNLAIEAAGKPDTYLQAVSEVAFAGRIVYIGYVKEDVCFSTKQFVMKELDICGSRNADIEDFKNVMKMMEENRIPTEKLITSKIPFEKCGEALAEWSEDPSKITKIIINMLQD
jgi:threonine dehydrogenase-like Zn-dependent dehydrogenase